MTHGKMTLSITTFSITKTDSDAHINGEQYNDAQYIYLQQNDTLHNKINDT